MPNKTEHKIITCLLPHHLGHSILKALWEEKKIVMANKYSARGSSYTTDFFWIEMEVLEVIVQADRADEIYDYLFEKAQMNTPHGGMIYQHALSRATSYSIPKEHSKV